MQIGGAITWHISMVKKRIQVFTTVEWMVEAWVTSPAKQFGDNNKQAGHPTMLSSGEKVWLAWQETHAGNVKKVMGMSSNDGGKTWSDATNLLSTSAKIDYSQLLKF